MENVNNFISLETCFIKTFPLDLPASAEFVYKNYNTCVQADDSPCIWKSEAFETVWISQDTVIVGDLASKQYILFGAITAFRSFTYFIVHKHQGRFVSVTAYQPEISKDGTPEEIIVLKGRNWRQLLIDYARMAAERMGAKIADTSKNCTGYCSWYYYYHQITERQFMESIDAIVARKDVFPVQFAQIDDGYQIYHGDWLDQNENWPTPLVDTVKKMNALGMQAGIWTMPFLASKSSKVFQKHPDWFVCDRSGKPWYIQGWSPAPNNEWVCLDVSRLDVQKHLYNIYETFYNWGFRYFKFDGGGFSAPAGIRCQPQATGISCLRDGLKLIRKAVKDSVILGCGMPFLASVGLVDHNRVSSDTGKTWLAWGLPTVVGQEIDKSQPCSPVAPSLKNAVYGTLCRWWQYDRWFRADPDVVMARDENTELTIAEARISTLTAIITGVAFTSDRLDRIGKDRLRLLSLAAKLRIRDIKPIDWENRVYSYLFEGRIENHKAIAVFNYSEYSMKLKLSELNMPAGSQELLHPLEKVGKFIEIAPHDAVLLVEGSYNNNSS